MDKFKYIHFMVRNKIMMPIITTFNRTGQEIKWLAMIRVFITCNDINIYIIKDNQEIMQTDKSTTLMDEN